MAEAPTSNGNSETLLEQLFAMETPKGSRAELIEGEFVVSPAPDGDHQDAIDIIVSQVYVRSRTPMQQSGNSGLVVPGGPEALDEYLIPDITFAPRELRLFRGASHRMACDGIAMVTEVTSTRGHKDRDQKRRSYARADIPLYLLIDRDNATSTLFSEPSHGDYVDRTTVSFGKPLPLPDPFGFELDTSDFL
ncbi:Uma2 family endonuclease [Streptomyces sp. NPDC003077]|uniref:Uma2 family endonuclease n=1 Tax=Streptomyces sp. NPDC003077 TaxID=3154443 RepID=UPI0033A09076